MTNPTSNFNWQMPTPTDLVTDLPADFEVFGQAVDTSMADLLGGTTGQILAKASNTNMDFTWITNDVGDITAVNVTSPITGGGSSGAVTIAIQDATTSVKGAVQLSDSTSTTSSVLASTPTATKAAYDLAASAYASGFTNNYFAGKNKIINGDMNIWQRGTTVTDPAGGTFLADRFYISYDGTAPTSRTYSQQTFALGTAPVAGYEGKFFARVAVTTKGSNTRTGLIQSMESVRTFAGQTVTISFWAKCDSARTGSIVVIQNFGTGGSPSSSVTVTDSAVSYSSSWARYSLTVAIPSIAGKTLGTAGNDYLSIQLFHTSADGSTFDIWGVQVEAGSVATPFQTATGSIGGELALCQRYYWKNKATGTASQFYIGAGTAATTAQFTIPISVKMRANANPLEYSTLALSDGIAASIAVTSLVIGTNSDQTPGVIATVASGLTANRPYWLVANASADAYVAFSSEL
jgi:hypothetical protein